MDMKSDSDIRSISTSSIIEDVTANHSLTIDISNLIVDDLNLKEIEKEWIKKYPGEEFVPDLIANCTTFNCKVRIEKQRIGYLSMKKATFKEDISFLSVTFTQEASFEKAKFKSNVNILLSTFERKATFSSARFDKSVSFEKSAFNEIFTCNSATFQKAPSFVSVQFGGLVFFQHTKVIDPKGIFKLDLAKFESTVRIFDFKCYGISMNNTVNYSMMAFEKEGEENGSLQSMSLKNMINLGQININWDTRDVQQMIHNGSVDNHSKAAQFALIKENYHIIGQYDWEDQAFLAHMRCRQKAAVEDHRYGLAFGYRLIDIIGRYGLNPARVACTMLVTLITYVFIYLAFFFIISDKLVWTFLMDSIINSCFAFIGLGYSPLLVIPENYLLLCLIATESIIGYFLLSYFLVALVRRTLR